MITIVLPCSGPGSRLGLPFPKELAPLRQGRVLIDSSLDLIDSCPVETRILLMDDGQREQTRQYIEGRLPQTSVAMARNPRIRELPDAIANLAPWLDGTVILMLPDVIYEADRDILHQLALLAEDHGFAMAATAKPEKALSSLGALVVDSATVQAYEEKPERPDGFNAAWSMFAMNGDWGREGLRVVQDVTRGDKPAGPPVIGAPVAWINDHRDCGTWDGYARELAFNSIGDANGETAGYCSYPYTAP